MLMLLVFRNVDDRAQYEQTIGGLKIGQMNFYREFDTLFAKTQKFTFHNSTSNFCVSYATVTQLQMPFTKTEWQQDFGTLAGQFVLPELKQSLYLVVD